MTTRVPLWAFLLTLAVTARSEAQPPQYLDKDELNIIRRLLESKESRVEWLHLRRYGEKALPYLEYILTDPESTDRQVERALIFAHDSLTKYDCKRLVEPTVTQLKHHDRQVKAEALELLTQIGSREDLVPVAVLLYAESKYNRIGSAVCLAKLGGKRELLTLDIWLRDKSREKDQAFDEVKKARDALRDRLDDEEKKLKAKLGGAKDDPKPAPPEKK